MKYFASKITPLLIGLTSTVFGQDQYVWQTVDNSFIPSFGNVAAGGEIGGSNTKVVTDLRNLNKNGQWRTYFANGKAGADLHPPGNDDALLVGAATVSGKSYWSQSYTSFQMPAELTEAEGARISFEVDFLSTLTSAVNIGLTVKPWDEVTGGVDLRTVPTDYTPNMIFLFGLVNLETGEIYEADFSSGGSHLFNYQNNTWKYQVDENGVLKVSFDLDSADLASITDAGLGLIIETTWGGGSTGGGGEYYTISNMTVEKLMLVVPEPSTAFLGVFGLIGLCARRSKHSVA